MKLKIQKETYKSLRQSDLRTYPSQEKGYDENHPTTTTFTKRIEEDETSWRKIVHLKSRNNRIFFILLSLVNKLYVCILVSIFLRICIIGP